MLLPSLPAATTNSVSGAAAIAACWAWEEFVPREAGVDDVGAHLARVREGVGDVRAEAAADHVASPQRHQRDVPVDPGDPLGVVALGADRARHVGAVALAVGGVVVVVDEVPAAVVVDQEVAVVVEGVALEAPTGLAGIGPDVVGQVRVLHGHAAVDDADHHRRIARRGAPGLGSVDVGVGGAEGAVVVERPLRGELGVVGRGRDPVDEVGLGEGDLGLGFQGGDRCPHRVSGTQRQQLQARDQQPALELCVQPAADRCALAAGGTGLVAHQDLAGGEAIAAGLPDVAGSRGGRCRKHSGERGGGQDRAEGECALLQDHSFRVVGTYEERAKAGRSSAPSCAQRLTFRPWATPKSWHGRQATASAR